MIGGASAEIVIFQKLLKLIVIPKKAHGPDDILLWLQKEKADLLAGLTADILNCPCRECTLPPAWKNVDVVPVSEEKPIQDINCQLRVISLTSIPSKLAEEFAAVMEKIDSRPFETVMDSCTTYALIRTKRW